MTAVRHWAMIVPADRYAQERLVANASLPAAGGVGRPGDRVALIAAIEPPVVFALGTVALNGRIRYTRRLFDAPLPADGLGAGPLPEDVFAGLVAKAGPAVPVRTWLVGVELPIEADSPAEAVRRYWSYLRDLGPRELPAFVAPVGDELAMQAYLLGEAAALDPEED
jgi:hypothetical protein